MICNETKIILDLCGGTGSWSKPYKEAGYDVRLVTLPDKDVRFYKPPQDVYGILAAPPCTMFTLSGNRWERTEEDIIYALSVVDACLRIVAISKPVFWCLENPVGTLVNFLGEPQLYFNPCDYGDTYTKHTCLWGKFHKPAKKPVAPLQGSLMHTGLRSAKARSITPPGFAYAFFEANR